MSKLRPASLLQTASMLPVVLLFAGTAASAQDAAPAAAPEAASSDQVILVTGSRIARPEESSPNPITTVDADNIERSGLTNLTDLLVQNPALIGSSTTADAGGSTALFGGVGINLLNLRNLGTDRTLVLVNGRRHVSGLPGTAAVDINTIPTTLVDRIDVLTGGVSAVYGADGVSGVVNFILKRDFEGIDARAQAGISSRGDAGTVYGSLTAGKNFAQDRGNIAVSYEYNRENRVPAFARASGRVNDYYSFRRNLADIPDDPNVPDRILYNDVRYADSSPNGAFDADVDFTPDFTGYGKVYDLGVTLPGSGGVVQGGDSTPVAGYQGDLQPKVERHNVNVLASFEFSPAVRLFAEGKYVNTKNFSYAQPSFDFFTILQADNPFLPAAIRNAVVPGALAENYFGAEPGDVPDGVLFSRDNFDLGVRAESAERETLRGVIGFDGDLSDHLRYELSYVYGQTKSHFVESNYRIGDRYFAALDAVTGPNGQIVCRSNLDPAAYDNDPNILALGIPATTFTPGSNSGCVPLNVAGENVASQAALAWINADLQNAVKVTQQVVNGSVSGDTGSFFRLPGGPIGFAVGAEYRKETSDFISDPFQRAGELLDLAALQDESGEFDVKEAFGEIDVPILSHVPFAELLRVGGAVRVSDYSTVGETLTWKVDGNYAPSRDINFRATYSEAVRAPNITELFAPQNGTFSFIDDPCDPVNIPEGTQYRQANCTALLTALGIDPAAFNPTNDPRATASLPGRSGGNPNLSEESARTWTAGVVLTPRWVRGLSITFDWYDIKLRDAISTAAAQDLVDLCVDQPTLDNQFCANVGRDPATGFVNDYLVGPANVAQFATSGADFTINYRFSPFRNLGDFNVRLAGGYLDNLSFVPTPGADIDVDTDEAYVPRWNGTLDLTWTRGLVSVNYGLNYFSETRRYTTEQERANPDLVAPENFWYAEKWEHDLQVQVHDPDERITMYAGVNNLFDELPDVESLNYPSSFRGRFMYAGVRLNWGTLPF